MLVGAITLLAVLARVVPFGDALYGDELSAYFVVTGHGIGGILDLVQSDQEVTPPLFFLLARSLQGIGDPAESLRWVPMISGVASVPLTYLLGTRTLNRRAALVGAALMALSPFLIFYSTEGRPYALLMLLCLGSTLALLRAIDGGGWPWWTVYALLSCATMYTHYTGAFLLAGQAAWALAYHRGAWQEIVGSNVVAAVGWLPWLSGYRADQESPGSALIGVLQPFGLDTFRTDVLHWAVGHPLTVLSVRDMPGDRALVPIALGLAIGLVAIVVEVVRGRWRVRLPGASVSLVLILALSSPVLAGLYSAVGESVFLPRNLIASSPGLALLLALLVTHPRPRLVWVPATALLVVGFAVASARMLEDASQRPDYEGVAAFIEERDGSSAVTVDSPGLSPGPFTQLDVALAPGEPEQQAAALRLGRPSHAAELRADQPKGPGQFALLPIASPKAIARRAVRRADGEPIFFVNPGDLTLAELRGDLGPGADPATRARAAFAAESDAAAFARALPSSYRAIETRTFPGLFGYGTLSVYKLTLEPSDS